MVMEAIPDEQIMAVKHSKKRYALIEISIFNTGFVASISPQDECETTEMEAKADGNLYINKDELNYFLSLINKDHGN